MSRDPLATYLKDHLAGSTAALELLNHLIGQERGTQRGGELAAVRTEIEQDRTVLRELLQGLGGQESPVRRAAAWVTEKIGQAKLHLDDPGGGELLRFEALEALALGIQGKAALWRALATASDHLTRLRGVDYASLERRALDQFARVDRLRLQSAAKALSS
jgi:hypothetical protein